MRIAGSSKRRRLIMTSALWIVQGLLALLFLSSGSMKLGLPMSLPLPGMTLPMSLPLPGMTLPMSLPLPGLFMRFIGIAEVAGAIGLILPGLLRIRPGLTPLAACGLVVIMIGATVVILTSGGVAAALFPLVVGFLCVFVAYGRRSWGWA